MSLRAETGYIPTEVKARCRDRDAYGTMREAYEAARTYTRGVIGTPYRCPSCRLWHVAREQRGAAR